METEEEEEQYTLSEILQLMAGTTHLPATHQAELRDLGQRNLTAEPQYDKMTMMMMMMMMGGPQEAADHHNHHHHHQDLPHHLLLHHGLVPQAEAEATTAAATDSTAMCGLETESCMGGDGSGGNVRWPRQETLALLEIRSRLDSKFRTTNQKGPLWVEISRIMAEEHGYQRSGKKCKEKFENLYKYYKKTKAGKVGRPDGKHYRFFRQLEALYGENKNPVSISLTNQEGIQNGKPNELPISTSISSELETSSSECHHYGLTTNAFMENNVIKKKGSESSDHRREMKKWKLKVSEFITSEMSKVMEMQEARFEKMFKTLEHKEQEMQFRREKWRKQDAERREEECKFWVNELASIKTRYALLTEILQKFVGSSGKPDENRREIERWKLCNEKQEIDQYVMETECNKKLKENARTCPYGHGVHVHDSLLSEGPKIMGLYPDYNGQSSNDTNEGTAAHDSCFQFLMS